MNSTPWLDSMRSLGLCSAIVAASACTERHPGEETDGDDTTITDGPATDGPTTNDPPTTTAPPTTADPTDGPSTDTEGDPTDGPEPTEPVVIAFNADADILFVIDNSLSMATRQAKLAAAMDSFLDRIEGLNYRIGITTTDSGNPRCDEMVTTPERGRLQLTSCIDRVALGEFEVLGEDASSACTDLCALTDADLPIKPTETHLSNGALAPRNWVEKINSVSNLPDGVDPIDALQCFIPQGVAGCGMESHLESMFLALSRANDDTSPTNHGFMRPHASLSVIVVSDEADCSRANDAIFTTNKVFWEDPDAAAPTSAACWNAGVACTGAGPTFETCTSANFGIDGSFDVPDEQAVLQPLARYIDFVQAIEDEKKVFDPDAEVRVMMLAGVPVGYESHDAEIVYEDAPDPQFQTDFGIGPGCLGADGLTAIPPVRERVFAEAFAVGEDRDLFSICDDSYDAALATMAGKIAGQIRPACMPRCVADVDPNTPTLEANCELFEVDLLNETRTALLPCMEVGGEWTVPAGSTSCFVALTDGSGETPSSIDNMSPECVAEGFNLEFFILRTGAPNSGVFVEATCELSADPAADCPLL
ncbi:VWA domain-containing protein [Nannocystis sp. SCPEA4]|uniref:VWA domain-containing protein n=1 Tax=Nannocystis sp. SCPEA4 TaxID=2996787 RepID=UPI00226EA57B|nr:VWA domain-containing protein [Nannocystis sp. SCPEA4]MCY1062737.1 VWA domain-containing protein [Nannocystis sp. SCPEA4]